jgi:hypothetical protein
MTRDAWIFAGVALLATAGWLAGYRLPLRAPRTRQRFRLWVSSRTGLPARYVFPIVGTAIYLLGGVLAATVALIASDTTFTGVLGWRVSATGLALTLLAVVGANSLTAFAMSIIYAVRPTVDVPGAVTGVRWIQEVLVLPRQWRWFVPMASAGVEEFFFRGVFVIGLLAAGAEPWAAIVIAGAIFTLTQGLLTENRLSALVLTLSSVVLSVVCGLLVVIEQSVLPAIFVHATFAGYYTASSAQRPRATAGRAGSVVPG